MSGLRKEVLSKTIRQQINCEALTKPRDLSPLDWSSFFTRYEDLILTEGTFRVYISDSPEGTRQISFLLLHGAGLTSFSWCCYVQEIKKLLNCRCVAVDLRNHGSSSVFEDLSIESLTADVAEIFEQYFCQDSHVVVVGHSLGGSIAVRIANQFAERVSGLVVLDAVEGLITEFIREINTAISSRPVKFSSMEEAILWRRESTTCRNDVSNRASMPSQLVEVMGSSGTYEWRIDLSKTRKYWKSWFSGMSNAFLKARAKKLLILTTADNLDSTLMVGQMQGKFQLVPLSGCGHLIQEDVPDKVAEVVAKFVRWHKFVQ